jgi:hypothetical protein
VAKRFLSPISLASLSSDPSSQPVSTIYYNSISNAFKYYNGTAWLTLANTSQIPVAGTDYIAYSTLGQAGGVATLDSFGYVPTSQINPSALSSLPSQSGNAGKYLTTNGQTASWGIINVNTSNIEINIIMGVY